MDRRRIPDLMLERLALGELSAAEATALRVRLDADDEARDRLQEIEADSAAFAIKHPAASGASEIERRAGVRRRSTVTRAAFVIAPALAAASLLLVLTRVPAVGRGGTDLRSEVIDGQPDTTRLKGLTPKLVVYLRTQAGNGITQGVALPDGATVKPHDQLQAVYQAAGQRHGAVIAIDGGGGVTVLWPARGEAPVLEPAGEVLLPVAYELDEAPGFERFFLVTAQAPIALDEVVAAARRLAARPDEARAAPLPLPPALRQTSVLLHKRPAATPPTENRP